MALRSTCFDSAVKSDFISCVLSSIVGVHNDYRTVVHDADFSLVHDDLPKLLTTLHEDLVTNSVCLMQSTEVMSALVGVLEQQISTIHIHH